MIYADRIGNTMAYEWWRGNRKVYFRLQKYLHMALTGGKTKMFGSGPYPKGER